MGRLRVIEGGQGRARPTEDVDQDAFSGEEATEISAIAFGDDDAAPAPNTEPEPADDGLGDVETVLKHVDEAPLMLMPQEFGGIPPARVSAQMIVVSPAPPGYVPQSQSHAAVPSPTANVPVPAAPRRRWLVFVFAGLAIVLLGGGLGIGWSLASDRESSSEPAPAIAQPTPPPAPAPRVEPPAARPAPAPAPRPAPVEITSIAHPALATVVAPIRGEIASVAVTEPRAVKAGDVLFTVRGKATRSARANELARRVAELETLAKQDAASYQPFLARTRRELAMALQPEIVPVKATAAGFFESRVAVRAAVDAGATLGAMIDANVWIAVATVRGVVPTAGWSCVVSSPDASHTAACKIQTTEALEKDQGTRVTVEILAAGTAWLADSTPRIQVDPPTGH